MRTLRFIFLLGCLAPVILPAQTVLTWPGVSGTWNLTNPNWSDTQVWENGATAHLISVSSGTFTLTLGSAVSVGSIDTTSVVGSGWIITGAEVLTLVGPPADMVIDEGLRIESVVAGTAGLTKGGGYSGSLTLTAANTYTGVTTIANGTLDAGHQSALGATGTGNGTTLTNEGSLRFVGATEGDFDYAVTEEITLGGDGGIGIEFETYASRTVTLSGAITLTSDGRLDGGTTNDMGSAWLNSTGVISDGGFNYGLQVSGTVGLSGTNTFLSRVVVEGGRLSVPVFNNDGVAGPLGAGNGLLLGDTHDIGEGGFEYTDGEVLYTGPSASSTRTIQLGGDTGTISVGDVENTLTLTGVISGVGKLEKSGPGTLILKAANTYAGDTDLKDGTLVVGHGLALGGDIETEVSIGDDGTHYSAQLGLLLENGVELDRYIEVYNYNTDGGSTTLGMAGSGTSTFAGDVYITRSVDVKADAGGTVNFTGFFSDGSGGGSVTKVGDGKVVFSGGVDLRGGSFDVNAGELRLNGAVIVPLTIDIFPGATLSGNATINEGVFVAGGGTLSPGSGPGTLTMDSLYVSNGGGGGTIKWELAALTTSDTAQFDRIVLTGAGTNSEIYATTQLALDLSLLGVSSRPANGDPLLNDSFWRTTQTWQVIDFSNGAGSGNLAPGALNPLTVTNGSWAGGNFSTFMDGTGDLMLQFTPVPEPSTYALLGLGGALLLLPRLRRRRE